LYKVDNRSSQKNSQRHLIAKIEKTNRIPEEQSHVAASRRASVTGNKLNLMVPVKFADHINRSLPTTADLAILMNNEGSHPLAPTGSVRDFYLASSYNQLKLNTTVTPWVTLPFSEAWYANGNCGLSTLSHLMIQQALDALQDTGFNFSAFDANNDGYVDAIGFLHSGYGAEWGGTDGYGTSYTNRIWSHKWSLWSLSGGQWTSASGVNVYNYHISPSLWATSGSAIGRIGVIAHETGHFFGLPDLYDGAVGSGIGSYCLMANSWGFDASQYYPPHMSAWTKIQLGWVTPTLITSSGTYKVRQGCNNPDVYQISTNFPSGEYLLIENRQKCSFDAKIPGPGLAIYHIDELASFTTEGYPGQPGWPNNGNHYRVALLQADGRHYLEKGQNRGDATDLFFSGTSGVNSISTSGTGVGAAYPNTKSYKGGIVQDTGISITNISAPSSEMSFVVNFDPISPTPPPPPTNQFLLTIYTDSWSDKDNAWNLHLLSPPSATLIASKPIGSYGGKKLYTESFLLSPGKYQFNLTDAYGDGLKSPAFFSVSLGAEVLKTDGAFKYLDSTTFDVVIPTTANPVTSSPISLKPATAKPTTLKPKTTTQKPITSSPISLKPTTAKPTTLKPKTSLPISSKPATLKPLSAQPVTKKPTTLKPKTATPKPITSSPISMKPTTSKPTTRKPKTSLPISFKPASLKPISAQPVTKKPAQSPQILQPNILTPMTSKPNLELPLPKPSAPVPRPIQSITSPTVPILNPSNSGPKPKTPISNPFVKIPAQPPTVLVKPVPKTPAAKPLKPIPKPSRVAPKPIKPNPKPIKPNPRPIKPTVPVQRPTKPGQKP
jgi:M6 family metalloprotease-like protein